MPFDELEERGSESETRPHILDINEAKEKQATQVNDEQPQGNPTGPTSKGSSRKSRSQFQVSKFQKHNLERFMTTATVTDGKQTRFIEPPRKAN